MTNFHDQKIVIPIEEVLEFGNVTKKMFLFLVKIGLFHYPSSEHIVAIKYFTCIVSVGKWINICCYSRSKPQNNGATNQRCLERTHFKYYIFRWGTLLIIDSYLFSHQLAELHDLPVMLSLCYFQQVRMFLRRYYIIRGRRPHSWSLQPFSQNF